MSRTAVIAHHGHCFDGMCSAAVLTRVLRDLNAEPFQFVYRGLDHQPGGSHVPESVLSGDLNAVVDFRYTTSDRLHWWFDHHLSGLASEAERNHFTRDASGRKFFDPEYGSCCKLISDVAIGRFGLELDDLAELVRWADVIDAARFPDARTAVELEAPAMQLMTVIEFHGDDRFLGPRIARLALGASLDELARDAEVQRLFAPLLEQHRRTIDAIARSARREGDVVMFDLVGQGSDRFNKFIAYQLHPDARYSVAVTAGATRAKVSVGSNPWSPDGLAHDIAAICQRFGGGGHRSVGAISLAPGDVQRAREIAAEITAELAAPARGFPV